MTTQVTWFDHSDISRGLEDVPVAVQVAVEGNCPMAPFIYVPSTILSEEVVVGNKRESSCYCYGQDCSQDPGACECMRKNGGACAYDADGRLKVEDHDVMKVPV